MNRHQARKIVAEAAGVSIERKPIGNRPLKGRRAHYKLLVNGQSVGTVRARTMRNRDTLDGWGPSRTGFEAGGQMVATQAEAERHLLQRQLTLINASLPTDVARAALAALTQ